MGSKAYTDHFCLVIYSQDQWKDRFEKELRSKAKGRFWELSGHKDCEVCKTCAICRSFEELFDPEEPGPYDHVCGACGLLVGYLKGKLGQADGVLLFSHYRPLEKELVEAIFKEKKVKKAFVLHLISPKVHGFRPEQLNDLKHETVSKSSFLKHEINDNVLYEIRRDEYMR